MNITTKAVTLTVAALLTATVSSAANPAAASPSHTTHGTCTPTWSLVPVPDMPGEGDGLDSVSALPDGQVRSVGQLIVPRETPWVVHSAAGSISEAAQIPQPMINDMTMVTNGSSFDSDDDGWVLASVNRAVTVAERWHDNRWTMTPMPLPADPATTRIFLKGVVSLSATDAWAVGGLTESHAGVTAGFHALGAVVEHWDGTAWTIVPNPVGQQEGTTLRGLTVVSPTDIWAAGYQQNGTGVSTFVPLVEHFDGSRWSVVTVPAGAQPSSFTAISASGENDIWAVGGQTQAGTVNTSVALVEHFDGTAWHVLTNLPDLGNARIDEVYAANPTDVWAIAENLDGTEFLHWDGSTWTEVPHLGIPGTGYRVFYTALSGTGPDDVWAVGLIANKVTLAVVPQVAHLSCGSRS